MALYTITLKDYIKQGGELPPCFSNIPPVVTGYSFEQAFIDRFNLREIGFETPALFYQRLNNVAMLKVPEYVVKIQLVADANNVTTVERTETISHTESGSKTVARTTGTENSATTESFVGAFNNTSGVASNENKNGETRGTLSETVTGNDSETNGNTAEDVHTLAGATEGERLATLEKLLALQNIYDKLLSEFDNLFMGIF